MGPKHVRAGDLPLEWDAELVGGLRLPGMRGSLERMMAAVEVELGTTYADMSREHKQVAVRVADAMGVSRFTIYNYLNAAG